MNKNEIRVEAADISHSALPTCLAVYVAKLREIEATVPAEYRDTIEIEHYCYDDYDAGIRVTYCRPMTAQETADRDRPRQAHFMIAADRLAILRSNGTPMMIFGRC